MHLGGGSLAGVWSFSEHEIFLLLVFFTRGPGLDEFDIKQW